MVDVVQFIFGFAMHLLKVFGIHFGKVVQIVRTLGIYTFVFAEKFPFFFIEAVVPHLSKAVSVAF